MQDDFIRVVAEVHIEEAHVAAQLCEGGRAVLVRVLPRPDAGFSLGFDQLAFLVVAGVDEGYIAVISLRLLVHQLEDTLRACKRHDDRVELLRNLSDRHGERLGQLEEGRDNADRDAVADDAGQRQRTADHRHEHVQQVADVAHDRHEDIREGVRVAGRLTQLIVQLVKLLLALVLVAEYLDDLLAVDHFLDVAVDLAERGLLREEVACGLAADILDDNEHDRHAEQNENRQPDVGHDHADEHRDDGHGGREHLRDRLAEHLLERIGIVRKVAHEVAVGVGVEIADGERLHMLKHIVAHALEHALRNADHQPVIKESRCDADEVNARHRHQRMDKLGEHRRRLKQQRRNVIVDEVAEEHRAGNVRYRRENNADQHDTELNAVSPADIFHQTVERLFRVLAALAAHHAAAARSAHLRSCHYSSPPFLFCWL